MQENYCYFNGTLLPFTEAKLALNDLGLWRGYGIFDYLRTYHGRPFKLAKHYARLERSAAAVGLELPLGLSAIEEITEELLYERAENATDVGFRWVLTGGYTDNGTNPSGPPNFFITTESLVKIATSDYTEGVKVITYEHLRELPEIKTTNYLSIYLNQSAMQAQNAKDVLYVKNGLISECTRTNFFLVKGNTLITPDTHILRGITRQIVLDIAPEVFAQVELRPLSLAELSEADEAFKVGTTNEVMPVVQIDDIRIGQGKPGTLTQKLMQVFQNLVHHS
ncbi:MAG: aminotransferase class IV [Microscillaceae bacterium]|jgi:D-alanine transaminase/branched-chain amino acid aminotransferase|nr:aminotransferase class IV [Microscillaceae bacterium]